jgi:Tetratricopeptide repeat
VRWPPFPQTRPHGGEKVTRGCQARRRISAVRWGHGLESERKPKLRSGNLDRVPAPEEVLDALRSALDADPDNVPVRVHLASLLVEAARPTEALEHCLAILSR